MSTINIQANELRVGNWVLFDGKIDAVTEIYSKGVTGENHARWDYDRLSPIKLTHTILEDCGFEKRLLGNDLCYGLEYNRKDCPGEPEHEIILIDFGIVDKKHSMQYALAIREIDRDIQFGITTVKHLHQLQNLYYSLTGKEIEYKPKK